MSGNTNSSNTAAAGGNLGSNNCEITVSQPSKEQILSYKKEKQSYKHHNPTTRVVVFIKWIATAILAILLLVFVTVSKVTVIAISENMHRNSSMQGGQATAEGCRMFAMLFLTILIPNGIQLLRGIYKGLFRKDIPWPKKRALFLGFFLSAIESFGIFVFALKIPAMFEPHNVCLLMNCVSLLPASAALFVTLRRYYKRNKDGPANDRQSPKGYRECTIDVLLIPIAFLLMSSGIVVTGYLWSQKKSTGSKDIWYPVVGILCLSVAWLPEIQPYLLSYKNKERSKEDGNDGEQIKLNKPTRKMVVFMSFWKLIFTCVFSFVFLRTSFFNVDSDGVISVVRTGFSGWRRKETYYFIISCCSSNLGYIVGFIACTTRMQIGAYVLPLLFATPLAALLFANRHSCSKISIAYLSEGPCGLPVDDSLNIVLFCMAVGSLVLSHAFLFGYRIMSSKLLVKQNETQIFWLPTYNGVLLEQWLLLSKRNKYTDKEQEELIKREKRIIICTTMYKENDDEMKQLLMSIKTCKNNEAQKIKFEPNIFFDDGVKKGKPTPRAKQLMKLVKSTFELTDTNCNTRDMPYGSCYEWTLNGTQEAKLRIHLKDITKVKKKKRWSQVMYMSYVLDHRINKQTEGKTTDTYILTTDADVRFTPDAVEALLDLIILDPSVGAVCARTHPFGSGPVYWYQVFEYALGHWFQKAAEHVIGTVLCAPGCFSLYRCDAIKDVLSTYATEVENALDFLTKDMGEDRWLCTLLIKAGWRIQYCAASKNKTYCPDEFDEFYKQRRRWVVSTLTNMWLLLKEYSTVRENNHMISSFFLLYQAILLIATVIGPSSVILFVSGGLVYGWGVDTILSMVLQILVCVVFALICILTSQKVQLVTAKFLTFVYSTVMMAVLVGMVVQVVSEFVKVTQQSVTVPDRKPSMISGDIHFSTTTVYLALMAGLFLLAGILHLQEFFYLVHSVWYLLFLPSGYIILTIYSICNITDQSWGTREASSESSRDHPWRDFVQKFKKNLCCCLSSSHSSSKSKSESKIGSEDEMSEDIRRTVIMWRKTWIVHGIFVADAIQIPDTECNFWKRLIDACLKVKEEPAYLKEEPAYLLRNLADKRNEWLMVFGISNALWMILISTLAKHGELLNVFGSNVMGLLVMILFTFILLIQFLAMIFHRVGTLTHFLGRARYTMTKNNTSSGTADFGQSNTSSGTADFGQSYPSQDQTRGGKRVLSSPEQENAELKRSRDQATGPLSSIEDTEETESPQGPSFEPGSVTLQAAVTRDTQLDIDSQAEMNSESNPVNPREVTVDVYPSTCLKDQTDRCHVIDAENMNFLRSAKL